MADQGYAPAIEYDEDYPLYWDMGEEVYYYYGYVLYFDEEAESYYYWDFDSNDYMYVDEESLTSINTNNVYSYNPESGEYVWEDGYYEEEGDAEDEMAEVGDEADGEYEEEEADTAATPSVESPAPVPVVRASGAGVGSVIQEIERRLREGDTTEYRSTGADLGDYKGKSEFTNAGGSSDPMGTPMTGAGSNCVDTESISPSTPAEASCLNQDMVRSVMGQGNFANDEPDVYPGSIDHFKASLQKLTVPAYTEFEKLLVPHDDSGKVTDFEMLNDYKKRPNGSLAIGRCKRTVDGLIRGTMELKSLTASDVRNLGTILIQLNVAQLLFIRKHAQNSAWSRAPQNHLKDFALKCDSLIHSRLYTGYTQRAIDADIPINSDVGTAGSLGDRYKNLEKTFAKTGHELGEQICCIIGALNSTQNVAENTLKKIGDDSWWWVPFAMGVVEKRRVVDTDPKGVFVRLVLNNRVLKEMYCVYDKPDGTIYRLISGRGSGVINWNIVEVKA